MTADPETVTDTYSLHRGTQPLLVSCPHDGTALPPTLAARMVENARRVPDTDWHVARLYDFAREIGASMIVPKYSRYVVDLNRPVDGAALYPGRAETGLVPTITFGDEPIYLEGAEPVAEEIAGRVRMYWQPYHDALAAELARLRAQHGRVVLWDAHSIRSEVPMFFAGRLPDFNLGTADGRSATMALQQRLGDVLASQDHFTHVVNGRFKGGHITRHYGKPESGIEAVQLELAQVNYMNEDSFEYLPGRAAAVQALVRRLLEAAISPL
jgi:N-formylglutamate deformylase